MNVPVMCCGENMEELIPGEIEASLEKHIPVIIYQQDEITISVGEIEHPMSTDHLIDWIVLETERGFTIEYLKPDKEPKVTFKTNHPVKSVYAYCNLHGLWRKDLS